MRADLVKRHVEQLRLTGGDLGDLCQPLADAIEALTAERDRLRVSNMQMLGDIAVALGRIEALTAQLAEDADARGLMDARLEQLVARVDALTEERDHAWAMVAKADTQVGQSLADHMQAKAERDRLREALHQIEITCDEEVCVRTAGMSEAALGKSRILPLLQIPRNIARAALKGETT